MPSVEVLRDLLVERATKAIPICADYVVEIEGMIDAAPTATFEELTTMLNRLRLVAGDL